MRRVRFAHTVWHDEIEFFDLDCVCVYQPGSPQTVFYPGDPPELESLTITLHGYQLHAPNGVRFTAYSIDTADWEKWLEPLNQRWKQVEREYLDQIEDTAYRIGDDWDYDDRLD